MTLTQFLEQEQRTDVNDAFHDDIKTQLLPDSQKQPLGPNQLEWIKTWILSNNFRDKEQGPMVKVRHD